MFLGGAAKTEAQRCTLAASRRLFRASANFECKVTHIVCARGALACAVVDRDSLVAAGVPMDDDGRVPHITLCTRKPWKPKNSNDVLRALAVSGALGEKVGGSRWLHALNVGDALLDVFVLTLAEPSSLAGNPLLLM